MAQITYANKVALNENPEVADINKVKDSDMNEIKQVVNDNYNNTIQITDTEPTDSDNKIWIDTNEVQNMGSEITNGPYNTSSKKAYSCNYMNAVRRYSNTGYTSTGKEWIDGEKIYREVFVDTSTTSGDHSISLSNINFDYITIVNFSVKSGNYVLNIYGDQNSSDKVRCFINTNTKELIWSTGSAWANATFTAVIEFTLA